MNHCQICTQNSYISINWKYANEGKEKELATLVKHLQPIRPLKFGYLYHCPISQDYWFLDDDQSFLYTVSKDKVEFLWKWDSQSLELTNTQIQALSEIGAIKLDRIWNNWGEIKLPCILQRGQNEIYDPAIIVITKLPPIQHWQNRILLGSTSDSISQSDFALSLEVRNATINAGEISMGFAPTIVKSSDNQFFVLNGISQIFSYGQLKGKDISLSDQLFRRENSFPIINEDMEHITFVHYDWSIDCKKLLT